MTNYKLVVTVEVLVIGAVMILAELNDCKRKCIPGESPKICHFNFTIENYYTMTRACGDCPRNLTDCSLKDCIAGDGNLRPVVTVNRQIPGPAIEVCQNDRIVVDVHNHLIADSTSIHWHGQHMKNTPYMDGVPFVTQCPIPPRTSFRYQFVASESGTHFWHSHFGLQRVDGCYGPLIVREPKEQDSYHYDFDLSSHTMTILDWEIVSAIEKFLYHHHSVGDNKPPRILVNGKGYNNITLNNEMFQMNPAKFYVEKGYRYRFRVINAGFLNCPMVVSVDNHTLKIISSDGQDINPVEAQSFVIYAGERFDFVLNANQPINRYWIRFQGLLDCSIKKAFQVAVLQYKDSSDDQTTEDPINTTDNNDVDIEFKHYQTKPPLNPLLEVVEIEDYSVPESEPTYDNSGAPPGKQINPLNMGTEANSSYVSMAKLSSPQKWDHSLKQTPDYQIYLAYDFNAIDNKHFYGTGYEFDSNVSTNIRTPQINHLSLEIPSFPLLPQRDNIPKNYFCNPITMRAKNCSNSHCECPYAYEIPLDSVVELVIIDEGFPYYANHPFHLHGYAFRVVAMERMGENVTANQVKKKDLKGQIKRNLYDAPLKDTVTIPDGGYTVIRFQANNPGFWFLHCHNEFHAEIGMGVIFKVGTNNEMPPVPLDFPTCGNYLPNMTTDDELIKPVCTRNSIINKFEKVLFGDYCRPVSSGSRTVRYFQWLIATALMILLSVFPS